MNIIIRAFEPKDLPEMTVIWNQVVEDGHYENIILFYHTL